MAVCQLWPLKYRFELCLLSPVATTGQALLLVSFLWWRRCFCLSCRWKCPDLWLWPQTPLSRASAICSPFPSLQGNLASLCLLWPTARYCFLSVPSQSQAEGPYTLFFWCHGRCLASQYNRPWSIASRQTQARQQFESEVSLHPCLGRSLPPGHEVLIYQLPLSAGQGPLSDLTS